MFKIDELTGYPYYSIDTLVMMINTLYYKYKDSPDQIPWDYISILLEDLDEYPEA
tara:strand:- start:545 stop:709 length:165 start_codon:yes stop_codon:yes gene_type:complete